ncbi:hypothetical protein Syun_002873 [Stephania yunnanensis]|uniref:Uncharacterized protein n=1 Tax=Stephania yunnanensis TaxID=152371 RepID=A0AAP0L0C9_9MAGN
MQTNSEKQGAEEGVKIRNCPFLSFTDSGSKSLQSLKAAEADSDLNLTKIQGQKLMATALLLGCPAGLFVKNHNQSNCRLCPGFLKVSYAIDSKRSAGWPCRRFTIVAATEGSASSSKSEETIPSWARPDSDEAPPWAREDAKETSPQQTIEVPFYAYLLASTITAIAAIGSIFEFINQKPVFGLLYPDSIFYVPLLGFFVLTGIPTSAFLWFKSVEVANREAEEQDRKDGFL